MFSERLVELRKSKGMTQKELSEVMNMSRDTLAHYEIGRREPDFQTLTKFAKYFNCTTDYLLGLSDTPRNEILPVEDNEDDIFAAKLAANMFTEYGKSPSPEFVEFAKTLRKELLEEVKKEKGE